ncbi:NADH-ubiquinone oxidoreductase 49 kDa subunit [Leguminivora glycinivorella]|uniref:NADH-ubiquinone oxidoreductase 49 kDa subunit n=1 Tax=Leguminivora glycinivorella TaxID=1035111 RepID=UPI00200E821E|nr:NADH-ubiquinone oxidoreductase 49 kDa subunit [Leguminivora glycinivorella]
MKVIRSIFFLRKIQNIRFFTVSSSLRGHKWFPDAEYVKQYSGPAIWSTPEMEKYYTPIYHGRLPPVERKLKNMWINFGPQHPAAHGVLRLILELDGETVVRADPHVGFLHRATEKLMENKHYNQSLPFMDRLDYVSALANEQTFALAVETLANIEAPPRAKAIRVLCTELSRVANHLLNVAGTVLDAGGITPFFWTCEEREKLYELFERLCGARVHCAYIKVGGVSQDLPIGYLDDVYEFCSKMGERLDEMEDLVTGNRLYYARTAGIGSFSAHQAINLGFSGPMLRCTGVKWDLRIVHPYDGYDQYDFDVPVGTYGDSYDRHLCRLEETRQALRILNQVIDTMPEGEYKTDDSKYCLPSRVEMKTSMESLIHHFKLCTEGYPVPPGYTYTATECPKGELGLYMVADGTSRPYRVGMRPCSYIHLAGIAVFGKGLYLADISIIVASIDVVFGDVDR